MEYPMEYPGERFCDAEVVLQPSKAIGMGNRRHVFAHPHHADLCIKVARRAHIRQQLDAKGGLYRWMPTHWRDDNWLEARAYRSLPEDKTQRLWEHLPRLHGTQITSLGLGLVFDYFHTGDGDPAPTLEALVKRDGLTPSLRQAVNRLGQYIKEMDLWMRHPGPPNIVMASDGRLKLVDCLGTYNMPLQKWLPAIRKRRIRRHIDYLDTALNRLTAP